MAWRNGVETLSFGPVIPYVCRARMPHLVKAMYYVEGFFPAREVCHMLYRCGCGESVLFSCEWKEPSRSEWRLGLMNSACI